MPKVSVVIPVYNAERFIDRCAQSVLAQSLSDIELILVDDGSTDNSAAAIERIARSDPRVRYIVHEANTGTARSRCEGIELANSPYLMHVDADDYVDRDFCQRMLVVAEREKCDLVCSNAYADRDGEIQPVHRDAPMGRISDQQSLLQRYFESRAWHVWRYIVRHDLFDRAKPFLYSNMPVGLIYDDIYLSYCLWVHTESIVGIPDRLYYHCYANPQSVTSAADPRSMTRYITQAAEIHAVIERDLKARGVHESVKRAYERHVLARNVWNFVALIKMRIADETTTTELLEKLTREFNPRMLLHLSPDLDVLQDTVKAPDARSHGLRSLLPRDSRRRRFARALVPGALAMKLKRLAGPRG